MVSDARCEPKVIAALHASLLEDLKRGCVAHEATSSEVLSAVLTLATHMIATARELAVDGAPMLDEWLLGQLRVHERSGGN